MRSELFVPARDPAVIAKAAASSADAVCIDLEDSISVDHKAASRPNVARGLSELDFGGKRNPDGQGFAAFGRVVRGMDVVRRIQAAHAVGEKLDPPVAILKVRRFPL